MRDFLEDLQKAHKPSSGSAFGEFTGFEVLLAAVTKNAV
jgi:hypothetical protein